MVATAQQDQEATDLPDDASSAEVQTLRDIRQSLSTDHSITLDSNTPVEATKLLTGGTTVSELWKLAEVDYNCSCGASFETAGVAADHLTTARTKRQRTYRLPGVPSDLSGVKSIELADQTVTIGDSEVEVKTDASNNIAKVESNIAYLVAQARDSWTIPSGVDIAEWVSEQEDLNWTSDIPRLRPILIERILATESVAPLDADEPTVRLYELPSTFFMLTVPGSVWLIAGLTYPGKLKQ